MAASATLHCLTGCALGEVTGLLVGTALGFSSLATVGLAVGLAFLFGYSLSALPLLKSGLALLPALRLVLLADTLSIATMELVDNAVMLAIPGAMESGLTNVVFWPSMALAFLVAYGAAYPVNLYLLNRNRGHALVHEYHGGRESSGWRARLWVPSTGILVALLIGILFGGSVVSLSSELQGTSEDLSSTH